MLRVLYGYLMACSATDIPALEFPRDEIIEIIPASYNNQAKRIHIHGLAKKLIPSSPEGPSMPIPPSFMVTPFSGISSPTQGAQTPEAREDAAGQEAVTVRKVPTLNPASQTE